MAQLSRVFHLTTERVRQILRKAGVSRKFRDKLRTDRDEFLGVNLTTETKDALKIKAHEAGTSMSKLVSDAVEEIVK